MVERRPQPRRQRLDAVVTVLAHHVGGGLPAGVSIGPSPSGSIACDAAGNLYVVDFPSGNVLKIAVGH